MPKDWQKIAEGQLEEIKRLRRQNKELKKQLKLRRCTMSLIQVGLICPDTVENKKSQEWLENLGDELNYQFVEILEGDESLVRDFSLELISPEEILEGEWNDSYVCADKELLEDAGYAHLFSFLESEREQTKNTFGETIFRPKY